MDVNELLKLCHGMESSPKSFYCCENETHCKPFCHHWCWHFFESSPALYNHQKWDLIWRCPLVSKQHRYLYPRVPNRSPIQVLSWYWFKAPSKDCLRWFLHDSLLSTGFHSPGPMWGSFAGCCAANIWRETGRRTLVVWRDPPMRLGLTQDPTARLSGVRWNLE